MARPPGLLAPVVSAGRIKDASANTSRTNTASSTVAFALRGRIASFIFSIPSVGWTLRTQLWRPAIGGRSPKTRAGKVGINAHEGSDNGMRKGRPFLMPLLEEAVL